MLNFIGYFLKYFQDISTTILNEVTMKNLGDITSSLMEQQKYILRNPALAVKEIAEITQADITDMLEEIKKRGTRISIISSADDRLLLMKDIQDNEKLKGGESKKLLDGFYSVKGGHHNLITNPDDSMLVIDQALQALNKKS